ncbi:phage portal protein [Prosthecochloris sp.]|uniref:phage portal protein n=1 Tax=Prosthecochloris sp. TaxID=290513 RepID=UPI0025E3DE30|nr:phage portal protein [Prosthecochloris sp.]
MSDQLLQNGRIAELLKQGSNNVHAVSATKHAGIGSSKFPRNGSKRHFLAGSADRLTQDWPSTTISSDEALYRDLEKIRGRSRWLADNNGYYSKFIQMCRSNILGPKGVRLEAKVLTANGTPDKAANAAVESAWKEWGRKGNCVFRSQLSKTSLERVIVNTVPRDGEIFLRKWFGKGPNGFMVEVIDPMRVPVALNRKLGDDAEIINGIEYLDGEVVAYWIGNRGMRYSYSGEQYTRVEAKFIEHLFVPLWAEQKRGFPWMTSSIRRMHMLDRYEEAETIQARIAAEKGGFFKKPESEQGDYTGEGADDDSGEVEYMDSEAGVYGSLPPGWDFVQFDPNHPVNAFEAFHSKLLKGIAAGGGVNYTSLANDLSDVNYSSARIGMLEVRDFWRELQQWLIESLHESLYPDWLSMSLSTQALRLPVSMYDQLLRVSWRPRTWSWIDPQKEAAAAEKYLKMRITTLSELAAERGQDIEDVFDQLQKELQMAKDKGIDLSEYFGNDNSDDAVRQLIRKALNGHAKMVDNDY